MSTILHDAGRGGRKVELEVWYPASAGHHGQDLAPATQDRFAVFGVHQVRQDAVRDAEPAPVRLPVVLFSHGIAGHRRQSTFFCTHLASHGYAVLAPDHGGHTLADLVQLVMRVGNANLPAEVEEVLFGHVADRPRDLAFVLDALGEARLPVSLDLDLTRVAASGHSFGGFTALALAGQDARVVSALALAPAGGEGPLAHEALRLDLDFGGRVGTLYLGLERDSLLPLSGVEGLFRRTSPPARMFVLRGGDHMHFCDRAESSHEFFRRLPPVGILADVMKRLPPFSALAPAEHGYVFANGLALAHLEATLRGRAEAEAFLANEALAVLSERGILAEARKHSPTSTSDDG